MKKISIFSAIIGILLYGCSSNEEVYNNYHKEGDKSFRVTVEQPVFNEARAHLDENLYVVFEDDDKMAVYENNTDKSEYTYSINDSRFLGTSLTEGEALDGIYALYPYSAVSSYNSGTLPPEQGYCENSFFNGSQIMYGKTDALEDGFNLKNMCGYIQLNLYGENISVKEIILTVTGEGEYVSGDFQMVSQEDNEYSLKMHEEGEKQLQSVKLVCPEGGVELGTTSQDATVFYIALPPQEYNKGFSVTIKDIFGREFTKTAFTNGGFELKRNHIKPMEELEVTFGADELVIVKGTDGNQYAQIDSPERLLKWGYTVNNFNNTLGFVLKGNITMPLKQIAEDPVNKTYKVTTDEISVDANGVPSGSNWVPLGIHKGSADLSEAFKGNIEGGSFKIENLLINSNTNCIGFVGEFADGSIKNLTISNSYIYSSSQRVGIIGENRYNTIIENVHLENSQIQGSHNVGGIVGYHYRRRQNIGQTNELLSYIINCSTDESSTIISIGTGDYPYYGTGGICGYNYGAAIINCVNKADVTGVDIVGGIVGVNRTYTNDGVNGYLLASGSTLDATITATNGSAGGLVGDLYHDRGNGTTSFGHKNSEAYVVACYSLSTISANHSGSIIGTGHSSHYGLLIASFAAQNELTSVVGTKGGDLLAKGTTASEHYASYTEISQDIINAMNSAIENYNTTKVADMQTDVAEKVKCHYRWQHKDDGWPILVSTTGESN